jgi:hypothetical protein
VERSVEGEATVNLADFILVVGSGSIGELLFSDDLLGLLEGDLLFDGELFGEGVISIGHGGLTGGARIGFGLDGIGDALLEVETDLHLSGLGLMPGQDLLLFGNGFFAGGDGFVDGIERGLIDHNSGGSESAGVRLIEQSEGDFLLFS